MRGKRESKNQATSAQNRSQNRSKSVIGMVESIVGCKWSCALLSLIAKGCSRPSELLRSCAGLSTKVMNERLRKMVRYGLLTRHRYGDKPPYRVEYKLTSLGLRFLRIVEEINKLQEFIESTTEIKKSATK